MGLSFCLSMRGRQHKLPGAEASKRAQCTSPGHTLRKGNSENSLELYDNIAFQNPNDKTEGLSSWKRPKTRANGFIFLTERKINKNSFTLELVTD